MLVLFVSKVALRASSRHGPSPRLASSLCHPVLPQIKEEASAGEGQASAAAPRAQTGASAPLPGPTHPRGSPTRYHLRLEALKSCAATGFLSEGERIHCCLTKSGDPRVGSLQNHLLKLYVKCGHFGSAVKLLGEMPVRNIISWNTVICGFAGFRSACDGVLGDDPDKGLGFLFLRRMMTEMVKPDRITLVGVVRTCVELEGVVHGEQVHCLAMKLGYSPQSFVGGAVVDMYAKFGLVGDARSAFDEVSVRDLVLWNVMVSCYALNGLGNEAFETFRLMGRQGVPGDQYTFSSLLGSACSLHCIELGRQIHGLLLKSPPGFDVVVGSAVVDMYGKCGDMKSARRAFDLMKDQNVVSWNSIIVSYGRSGDGEESMKLLRLMLRKGMGPDELTLSSVLSSCGEVAKANEVIQVHNCVVKSGSEAFLSIGNALIGAYGKCGLIYNAILSFTLITEPDVVAWTSIISAYAVHGLGKEALESFEKMLHSGVRPDEVAFLVVLSACSHSGLVDAGMQYFTSMVKEHLIKPNPEHYTCLVDLLGRAGFLEEAYKLLVSVPSESTVSNLGAFLGACKLHGNMNLAEWAADSLFTLQPNEPVNYMLLSNIYAAVECRNGEERVRNKMRRICGKRLPGCSRIEVSQWPIHSSLMIK